MKSQEAPQPNDPIPVSGQHGVRLNLKKIPPRDRANLGTRLARTPFDVPCRDGHLRFLNVSKGAYLRASGLHEKEPATLRWIDRMEPGSVFWDIGANLGVMSLYAAQRGDLDVHAFEPAAVNYYLLTGNCELNGFSDRLSCYLLGFSDRTCVARIEASQLAGGASFSFKGKRRKPVGQYQTCLLFSIDDFLERFEVPFPNYVKIDVPGLTAEIFSGAAQALARPELREIQVELRENKAEGPAVLHFVESYGFGIIHRNERTNGDVKELVLGRAMD
jgi:FkbM family methyltransferase